MPAAPLTVTAAEIDLQGRFVFSNTVAASPSGSTETTICTITIPGDLAVTSGVRLRGWAAYTVGTSGTAVTLKIRQTDTSGSTKGSTGALTAAAGNLRADSVAGVDAAPSNTGQVYVLTMTVTAGAAASTVSACTLEAVIV